MSYDKFNNFYFKHNETGEIVGAIIVLNGFEYTLSEECTDEFVDKVSHAMVEEL